MGFVLLVSLNHTGIPPPQNEDPTKPGYPYSEIIFLETSSSVKAALNHGSWNPFLDSLQEICQMKEEKFNRVKMRKQVQGFCEQPLIIQSPHQRYLSHHQRYLLMEKSAQIPYIAHVFFFSRTIVFRLERFREMKLFPSSKKIGITKACRNTSGSKITHFSAPSTNLQLQNYFPWKNKKATNAWGIKSFFHYTKYMILLPLISSFFWPCCPA